MKFANTARSLTTTLAATAMLALSLSVATAADDAAAVTPSHLKAARAAIAALHITDPFDSILPQAARSLKNQLIEKNPNLQDIIVKIVDEKTLALVPRRADLENEAARAYAKLLSEQELNAIATFYNSEAGKKLIQNGPIASRQIAQAAEIWQRGIARDLAQSVGDEMAKEAPNGKVSSSGSSDAAPAAKPAPKPAKK
ncbi:MAG TPA: DUF2059 domain-containing protein [Rhizobiaceae bacterium]|jgi:hypothetical protein|nr:DUF2059 domain-containing protein [Rhizobiaceae bacterium]